MFVYFVYAMCVHVMMCIKTITIIYMYVCAAVFQSIQTLLSSFNIVS